MILAITDEKFDIDVVIDGQRVACRFEFTEGDINPKNWDNPVFAENEIQFNEYKGRTYAVNKHANGRRRFNRSY
jgi:hypothetical protein